MSFDINVYGKPLCAKCKITFLPDQKIFIMLSATTVSFKQPNYEKCVHAFLAHINHMEMGYTYNLKYNLEDGESHRKMLSFCEKCFAAVAGEIL